MQGHSISVFVSPPVQTDDVARRAYVLRPAFEYIWVAMKLMIPEGVSFLQCVDI
jgi:hypothetical protein